MNWPWNWSEPWFALSAYLAPGLLLALVVLAGLAGRALRRFARLWMFNAVLTGINVMAMGVDVLARNWWLLPINALIAAAGYVATIDRYRRRHGSDHPTDPYQRISWTPYPGGLAVPIYSATSVVTLAQAQQHAQAALHAFGGARTLRVAGAGETASWPPPPVVGEPVDDCAIGWREWRVHEWPAGSPAALYPRHISGSEDWKWSDSGWTKGQCAWAAPGCGVARHDVCPDADCTCGLHLRTDWTDTTLLVFNLNALVAYANTTVLGAVVAKGRVIEHALEGIARAEYARPVALAAEVNPELARLVAQAYEIPLVPLAELHEYALRFGRDVNEPDA